jgi:hypothetical protein
MRALCRHRSARECARAAVVRREPVTTVLESAFARGSHVEAMLRQHAGSLRRDVADGRCDRSNTRSLGPSIEQSLCQVVCVGSEPWGADLKRAPQALVRCGGGVIRHRRDTSSISPREPTRQHRECGTPGPAITQMQIRSCAQAPSMSEGPPQAGRSAAESMARRRAQLYAQGRDGR